MNSDKLKVLFVCMGNICRSPLAEGVFRHQVREAGLSDRFEIDSAGTSSYHIGDPPDQRTTTVARARGIELTGRARQIKALDLSDFDYVLAMDEQNMARVQQLAKSIALRWDEPAAHRAAGLPGKGRSKPTAEVRMLRDFDDHAGDDERDVPDPYYGGARGFEDVHDIVERSCARLLAHIRAQHNL